MPRYAAELLVRCRECDLVYVGRLPSATELSEYYAAYPANAGISALTALRFGELLDRLESFRGTGRLLDVGCGDGHFLVAARERGWTTYGSEYGQGPRERAQQRGLDVRPAPFAAAPDEVGSFDVVTSVEVIEHVTDPRDEVARMSTLLRPGGALYLTTPNFNSLTRRITGPNWRVIEYPEHLNLFTPRTLDRLLTAVDLSKRELRTTGVSPTDIRAGLRPARAADVSAGATGGRDERLRSQVASSPALDRAVGAVNAALSRFGLGDTIKALYQRP
jgi:2-polyprenyl-3-methyl-5-hydroxy-6-metoxy-1,4-benzoquinol methylase